MTVVYSTTVNT